MCEMVIKYYIVHTFLDRCKFISWKVKKKKLRRINRKHGSGDYFCWLVMSGQISDATRISGIGAELGWEQDCKK